MGGRRGAWQVLCCPVPPQLQRALPRVAWPGGEATVTSSQATGRPVSSSLGTMSSHHQLPKLPGPRGYQFPYREGVSLPSKEK